MRWLWLYLVTVLAFTIITFALWFIWQRREALNAVSWLHHHTSAKESKSLIPGPEGLSSLPTSRSLPPKVKINPALRNYGGLGPEVNVVFPPVFVPSASEVIPTNVPQKMKARFSKLEVVAEEEIKVKKTEMITMEKEKKKSLRHRDLERLRHLQFLDDFLVSLQVRVSTQHEKTPHWEKS